MSPNLSACCLSLLVLLHCAGAGNLQTLDQLFREQLRSSKEERGERDGSSDKALFGAPQQQWGGPLHLSNSALAEESVLARLFKELTRTSKRSWSRYKKGGLRSCFGVRLERIGSFSGLGC
ncbi:C-type natriuretic peptide 3 [Dissostichus eleginoides]|uniref:C-type natriuretic peptide 3 n=1 Tax=Dissostichus eleginoides TaxID=100907 RepID=A0AAD9CBS7_DISEL|nr:C-type natriuretic peptide 3 [Dissostichus eleginoides]